MASHTITITIPPLPPSAVHPTLPLSLDPHVSSAVDTQAGALGRCSSPGGAFGWALPAIILQGLVRFLRTDPSIQQPPAPGWTIPAQEKEARASFVAGKGEAHLQINPQPQPTSFPALPQPPQRP